MTKTRARQKKIRTECRAPCWRRHLLRARTIIMGYLPVIAIFLGTRALVAEAYRIPSGSMEPTVQVGDWLFVNKLRLGPHIPFSNAWLPGYGHLERNDVVVFVSPPQDPAIRISPTEITPTLVKRIIGLPGDTLFMRHGELFVNGVLVARRNTEFVVPDSLTDQRRSLFSWQHRIEVKGSRFGAPTVAPSVHEWGPLLVPPAMFFMIGDNRDNSVDSRYYGPVPRANLIGTPMFVYYSYDTEEGLDYFRAITEIRWRRLGTWIR